MKIHVTALAAAALLGLGASSAMAAQAVSAKLQAPLEAVKRPVAGGAAFVCKGDTCTTTNPGADTLSVSGCRELVRSVGAVASYGTEAKQFDADKLARCNMAAGK